MPSTDEDFVLELEAAVAADQESAERTEPDAGASAEATVEEQELLRHFAGADVRSLSNEEREALQSIPGDHVALIEKILQKEKNEIRAAQQAKAEELNRKQRELERREMAAQFGESIVQNPDLLARIAGQQATQPQGRKTVPLTQIDFDNDPEGAEDQFVARIADKLGFANLEEKLSSIVSKALGSQPEIKRSRLATTAEQTFSRLASEGVALDASQRQTILNAYRTSMVNRGRDPYEIGLDEFAGRLEMLADIASRGRNGQQQPEVSPSARKAAANSVSGRATAPTKKQTLTERLGRKATDEEFLASDEGGVTLAELEEALKAEKGR